MLCRTVAIFKHSNLKSWLCVAVRSTQLFSASVSRTSMFTSRIPVIWRQQSPPLRPKQHCLVTVNDHIELESGFCTGALTSMSRTKHVTCSLLMRSPLCFVFWFYCCDWLRRLNGHSSLSRWFMASAKLFVFSTWASSAAHAFGVSGDSLETKVRDLVLAQK